MDECASEAEVPPATVGGIVAGERDLGGKPAAAFGGGYAIGRLASAAGRVEIGGDSGLLGGCGRLTSFQLRDAFDQRGLMGDRVGHRG